MGELKPINKNEVTEQVIESINVVQTRQLFEFNTVLDRAPSKSWIKTHPYNKSKYVPIRIVEHLLRSIYGEFETEMVGEPKIIGNSVVVSIHLKVWHPIFGKWITKCGTGAVPIQVAKDASPIDFTQINATGLNKVVPAAKGYAVSNAAKSLGKIFGSSLNSKADEVINPIDVWGNLRKEVEDRKKALSEPQNPVSDVG